MANQFALDPTQQDPNQAGYAPQNTSANEQMPISNRSFAMARQLPQPTYNQAPQMVRGVGLIGPDLGGAVKGTMMRQDYDLKNAENARQEEVLGLAKADLGVKKDYLKIAQADLGIRFEDLGIRQGDLRIRQGDFAMRLDRHSVDMDAAMKAAALKKGSGEAYQRGGYSAVVDFLAASGQTDQAIQLHANKLALDDKILGLPALRVRAQSELANAQMSVYSTGGAFAQSLLEAPEKDRAAMYENGRRMLAPVLGDLLPETLDAQAISTLSLMAAQATPQNILYSNERKFGQFQSGTGKLNADIISMRARGASYADSPELRALEAERDQVYAKSQEAIYNVAKAKFDVENSKEQTQQTRYKNTSELMGNLTAASTNFTQAASIDTEMQANLKALKQDPYNLSAQQGFIAGFQKALKSGSVSMTDLKGANGTPSWFNTLANATGEIKQNYFNTKEIQDMTDSWRSVMKGKYAQQQLVEQNYKNYLSSNPNVFNGNGVEALLPSNQYLQMQSKQNMLEAAPALSRSYPWIGQLPPDLQADAIEAITQKNKSPDMVLKKAQILMQQRAEPMQVGPNMMNGAGAQQQQQGAMPVQMGSSPLNGQGSVAPIPLSSQTGTALDAQTQGAVPPVPQGPAAPQNPSMSQGGR